jgi:hypothetical protein
MFDDNLVGYLLKALDPAQHREVEGHLQAHPEAERNLDLLSQALAPLEADRETPEPPPTLRVRTLARVAEYRLSILPPMPQAPPVRSVAPRGAWWSRADVLVAASILLLILPFIPPAIFHVQQQHNQVACENNLRNFHQAFVNYWSHHNDDLPKVEDKPPRNFAGVFVPVLHDAGVLSSDVTVTCPSNGHRPAEDISLEMLEVLQATNPKAFEDKVCRMSGCYAYSLGYRDASGQLHGIRHRPDNDRLPIMADRPPFDQKACADIVSGNSKNHGCRGQNVLLMGGNVFFATSRNVGIDGDDIYLNRNNLPAAGVDDTDTVLGASSFRPTPPVGSNE